MLARAYKEKKKCNKTLWAYRATILIFLFMAFNIYFNTGGGYLQHANVVMLFPKENTLNDVMYISSHEIGHYIWFTKLTEEERNKYIEIFNNSTEHVTEYAKRNVQEDFAETFAWTVEYRIYPEYAPYNRKEFFEKLKETIIYR
jgi:hypothetical protein